MASLPDLLGGTAKQYRSILALQVTTSQTLVAPCDGLVDLSVIGAGGSGGLYVQNGMAPTAAFGGGLAALPGACPASKRATSSW